MEHQETSILGSYHSASVKDDDELPFGLRPTQLDYVFFLPVVCNHARPQNSSRLGNQKE
tara:strand:+ start:344 stop:520 length:177 start_codon:yes stop_codon:yes gene_type:complete